MLRMFSSALNRSYQAEVLGLAEEAKEKQVAAEEVLLSAEVLSVEEADQKHA